MVALCLQVVYQIIRYQYTSVRTGYFQCYIKVGKIARMKNQYNQVTHLTQDTNSVA